MLFCHWHMFSFLPIIDEWVAYLLTILGVVEQVPLPAVHPWYWWLLTWRCFPSSTNRFCFKPLSLMMGVLAWLHFSCTTKDIFLVASVLMTDITILGDSFWAQTVSTLCLSPWWQGSLSWWCFQESSKYIHLSALVLVDRGCLPDEDFQVPPNGFLFLPQSLMTGVIYLVNFQVLPKGFPFLPLSLMTEVACIKEFSGQGQTDLPYYLSPWWQGSLTWQCFLGPAKQIILLALFQMMGITYLSMFSGHHQTNSPFAFSPSLGWWGHYPAFHVPPNRFTCLPQSIDCIAFLVTLSGHHKTNSTSRLSFWWWGRLTSDTFQAPPNISLIASILMTGVT